MLFLAKKATPPGPGPVQPTYIRVRDMKDGDIVAARAVDRAAMREVLRVEPGSPAYAMHFLRPGSAALKTSKLPGAAQFILLRRADA